MDSPLYILRGPGGLDEALSSAQAEEELGRLLRALSAAEQKTQELDLERKAGRSQQGVP